MIWKKFTIALTSFETVSVFIVLVCLMRGIQTQLCCVFLIFVLFAVICRSLVELRIKSKELQLLQELAEHRYEEHTFDAFSDLPMNDELRRAVEAQINMEKETDAIAESERQATLQALQSQINPHFLYNTLECIRGQALMDGNSSVANMLEALGNFFRYSISHRENIVTLADEISNIQSYMLIQNYRFSNRYQLEIEFLESQDALLGCYMPKLTLQPIVENALLHGFQNRRNGLVTLTVDASDSVLLLTVSDDGEGMEDTVLNELNMKIQRWQAPPSQPASHGNGIALQNVNRRIVMLYGHEFGVHAYSTLGHGTDVEIVLPRITQMEIIK